MKHKYKIALSRNIYNNERIFKYNYRTKFYNCKINKINRNNKLRYLKPFYKNFKKTPLTVYFNHQEGKNIEN